MVAEVAAVVAEVVVMDEDTLKIPDMEYLEQGVEAEAGEGEGEDTPWGPGSDHDSSLPV